METYNLPINDQIVKLIMDYHNTKSITTATELANSLYKIISEVAGDD